MNCSEWWRVDGKKLRLDSKGALDDLSGWFKAPDKIYGD